MYIGRPKFTNEQYNSWLDDLKPFLKQGRTLRSAIESAGLTQHKNVLYRYYRENEDFRDKIDYFQSYLGELVNVLFAKEIDRIYQKTFTNEPLSRNDVKIFVFFATHHRSCQPFFVTRVETSSKRGPLDEQKIGKIIESLDTQ